MPPRSTTRFLTNFDAWPGRPFHFSFAYPPIAASSLTASEPHKLRKTPIKCQTTPGCPRGVGAPQASVVRPDDPL
ncbi:hypothetical protein CN116_32585 [Sinorhizobium meliloti]|nr:hypothetical protein CN240_01995 [Sinorhizobium meliloti]RVG49075.1 hypothetical protein CN227_03790 [Sinorhizobium meliloti]RVM02440.1 hypothetical protein CN125_32850 [Sinorhizobium meliloti]RVM39453.1 hypothetical protein CN121_32715 [Sinorhizobium meliloti]RVM55250.1 hypothetical protein CN124_32880 [Sinorhizobium meliloti]